MRRVLLLVLGLTICSPLQSMAKKARPTTWSDFVGTWIGYDGGWSFVRLTLDKKKLGTCVQIDASDDSVMTHSVTVLAQAAEKGEVTLQMNPISGTSAEPYELKGRLNSY